nr:hypothetical protein CK203_077047 [Ipomoea batatas]
MVASNDVDDNKHVSSSDEPSGFLEGNEDVILNRVSKHPVSDDGHRKVAQKHDGVGHPNSLHHGFVGRLLRRGRDGGLNLQHHVVAGVGERHVSQGAEELEHSSYVLLMGVQEGQMVSWNFLSEVPPVTMYTMFTPICTISCCGTTTYSPTFSPNAYCPSSWYRSSLFPGSGSCISTICHSVYSVITHDIASAATPGPLHVFALLKPEILLHIELRTNFIITVAVFLASSAFIKLDHFMILHNSGAVAPLTAVGITTLVVFQDRLLRKGKFNIVVIFFYSRQLWCGMSKPNGVAQVASEETQWGSSRWQMSSLYREEFRKNPGSVPRSDDSPWASSESLI